MSKWLHILATIGGAALTVYSPSIQSAISSHPQVATGLLAAFTVIGNLLHSPVAAPAPAPVDAMEAYRVVGKK